jgi:predicted DNA-binding transcriptional regulator AlpA
VSSVTPLVSSDASDADDVELITPEELAELWKVQTSWIYKATKWKKDPLPHVKLGKYTRFSEARIREWRRRHEIG